MDEKVVFQLFKNIIKTQNERFISDLAKKFGRDPDVLLKNYLKPDYYLPIVEWDKKCVR
jgi:hypothetical protein